MYINHLDFGISSNISKFADDMKKSRIIRLDSDAIAMQTDLDGMNECTDRWQMQFNINQCKVLRVGKGKPQCIYAIKNEALIDSEYDKHF